METIMRIIEVMTPIFVALVTVYGGVLIAKVNKLQKDMKTNHGSTSPGHAIDRIYESVELVRCDVAALKENDHRLNQRLTRLEKRRLLFHRRRV